MSKLDESTQKAIDDAFEAHFEELVPSQGNADTIQGEVVRALMKLGYRYYNDGDYYYRGYGCETAGPAHAFLVSKECPIHEKMEEILNGMFHKEDEEYEEGLFLAMKAVNEYVESSEVKTPNKDKVDFLSYDSMYCDEEEEDEDDWDEDEDDSWEY